MNGLERCPNCYKLPEIKIEDKGFDKNDYIFSCERHGHIAQGQTVESAKANWNLYVMLFPKVA